MGVILLTLKFAEIVKLVHNILLTCLYALISIIVIENNDLLRMTSSK